MLFKTTLDCIYETAEKICMFKLDFSYFVYVWNFVFITPIRSQIILWSHAENLAHFQVKLTHTDQCLICVMLLTVLFMETRRTFQQRDE